MGLLYLVRHGQASLGSDNYDQLSKLGKLQARLLGESFRTNALHFDQVIHGSQVRHLETAAHFFKGYQADQKTIKANSTLTMPHFNEFNFEAIIRAYLKYHPDQAPTHYQGRALFHLLKQSLISWSQDELNNELEESWHDFQLRVRQGLLQLQADFHHQHILLFTSGGPIASLLCQILETSTHACIDLNLQIQNTSVTQCFFNQEKVTLDSFNSLPHLQAPERMSLRSYS